jgi:hypothetical protein
MTCLGPTPKLCRRQTGVAEKPKELVSLVERPRETEVGDPDFDPIWSWETVAKLRMATMIRRRGHLPCYYTYTREKKRKREILRAIAMD